MNFSPERDSAPVSRKQFAYEQLRARILSLELEPNTPLFEIALANDLGISRTPIREALAALEREGLVQMIRGKGAFVAPSSIARILETYQVREMLEGLAARLAVGRVDASELQKLKDVFNGCVNGELTDARIVTEAADSLHLLLAEESGNQYLVRLLKQMSDQVRRIRQYSIQRTSRLEESSQEHIEIIEAIQSGDGDLTERLMRRHIESVRRSVEATLGQRIKV